MATSLQQQATGASISRLDGPKKVTGTAKYAFEYDVDDVTYAFPVQSTIAKGRITSIDTSAAQAIPGVLLVLTHENAPRINSPQDAEFAVLQTNVVGYRGQFVALVVAETLEVAREGAEAVAVHYEEEAHRVVLHADDTDLYKPEILSGRFETDTARGDIASALASSAVTIDQTYTTPAQHNHPLEPHALIALWRHDDLTLYDSNQGSHMIRNIVAQLFELVPERVRVIAPYVGGGFGSKGTPHAHTIVTIMAAKVIGRPVKLALTRQQMFSVVGYRTPTIQHIRLGANSDGRLTAISHEVVEQTSTLKEFAESTASATRIMYAAPHFLSTHRLARLDVPIPTWMRAPGVAPGMFALESAIDELAIAMGIDPIELRVRNEPDVDPDSGLPFSSRGLMACLQEGAQRFDWKSRDPQPGRRSDDCWLIGTGIASSTHPTHHFPASAIARVDREGHYTVQVDASDIGTGAWTILTQIAADALEVPLEQVQLEIGDSHLPPAFSAGGSSGTNSWGTAIVEAARKLRQRLGDVHGNIPAEGISVRADTGAHPAAKRFAMHGFGAQFAEVWVNRDSGEVRVPRLLGVFATGRIINPKTARSQFLGGMTWGLSMALHEESVMDPHTGDYVNHDFAGYHIATHADVGTIDVSWIDEDDPFINPMGAKGIGEIGIVGTAAAIANAVYHATGVRVRDLPITPDKVLGGK